MQNTVTNDRTKWCENGKIVTLKKRETQTVEKPG